MMHRSNGFTIVELLVVVVVIAILAAITIISFNGIDKRATETSVVSFLNSTSKKLKESHTYNNAYPATLASTPEGPISVPSDIIVSYTANNATNPATFSLSATSKGISYLTSDTASPTRVNASRFTEQFFNNQTLTGSPVQTNEVTSAYYNWGSSGPVTADNFSARWTGNIRVPETGSYTFYATSDDGQRLYIDGLLVVDDWVAHGPTTRTHTRTLTAGQIISLKYEYFEISGGAVAQLEWLTPSNVRQPITAP